MARRIDDSVITRPGQYEEIEAERARRAPTPALDRLTDAVNPYKPAGFDDTVGLRRDRLSWEGADGEGGLGPRGNREQGIMDIGASRTNAPVMSGPEMIEAVRVAGTAGEVLTQRRGGAETRGGGTVAMMEPEVVEATRLPMEPNAQEAELLTPRRPVVEAVRMVRGAPGSGDRGENLDLNAMPFRRMEPLSVQEARAGGMEILEQARPVMQRGVTRAGQADEIMGILERAADKDSRQMSVRTGGAAQAMEDDMNATRAVRWGQSGPTRGARGAGTGGEVNAEARRRRGAEGNGDGTGMERVPTGTQERAQAIRDREGRIDEARRTPQAVAVPGAGAALYDPKTGQWKYEGKDGAAGPESLDSMDEAKLLEGLTKYGRPKALTPKDLDPVQWGKYQGAKTEEERRAVLEGEWTPDAQEVYRRYSEAARRRGLVGGEGGVKAEGGKAEGGTGTGGSGRKSWREVVK